MELVFKSTNKIAIYMIFIGLSISASAQGDIQGSSAISSAQESLINQLDLCIGTAIQQGISNNSEIVTYCQQQVDDLEQALPNLAGIMIQDALN